MGSFPSAALSIRPPENPLDQYAKALSVKSMIQGQKTEQLQQTGMEQQNEQRATAMKDQQATTAAMQEWDGKKYDDLYPLIIKHGGSSNAVMGLQKAALGMQEQKSTIAKNDSETGAKNLETLQKKNDMLLGHLSAATAVDDDQLITQIKTQKNAALLDGVLDPQHADAIDQLIAMGDPKKIRSALSIMEKGLTGQKEQFDQAIKERDTAAKEWKEIPGTGMFYNTRTNQTRSPDGTAMTPSMMESKYVQLTADDAMKKPLTDGDRAFMKGYEKMKTLVPSFNFNMAGGATGGLDQAALDQQAERYWQTGQLPPVGRSIAGMALTHTIMQRASDLHKGESLAANSASFKANQVSLDNLQKTFDQVSAFEGTALRNLDLYVSKMKAIPDLGVKFANVPLRSITGSMIGAGNYAAMQAAHQTAATEVAKVLGSATASGVLSDSQKKDAVDVLDGNLPLDATSQVVDTLKQDFGNRHESYQNQIADIKGRMEGKSGTNAQPNVAQHTAGGKASGLAEGQTGTGSDGKKYIVKGGVWVPR
jgi:hypothetical protein